MERRKRLGSCRRNIDGDDGIEFVCCPICSDYLRVISGATPFKALVSAAEAHFGSWGKALYAAGIDPNLYFVHHKWHKSTAV